MRYVPTWKEAQITLQNSGEDSLAQFVYSHDPAGSEVSLKFRRQLRDTLNEALDATVYVLSEDAP